MTTSRDLVARSEGRVAGTGIEAWADTDSLRHSMRGLSWFGWMLSIAFLCGFCLWAGSIRLAGGAIAPGVISPEGNRKTVQHLEGGIVSRLLVRDGDVVTAGQPLIELESLQPRASYDALFNQQQTLRLTRLRLEAEKAGHRDLVAPADFDQSEAGFTRILAAQRDLLAARSEAHEARRRVLGQRSEQLNEQILGFEAQVRSANLQLELIADELAGKRVLFKKGLMPKPLLRQLERAEAEIGGRLGEYRASIARAREQIGEAKLEILSLDAERLHRITSEFDKVQLELATVDERLRSSADILARTVIAAPVSGKIVDLRFKAERGVVQPGVPIMDIVPTNDTLMIDAKVSPVDIDVVRAGLLAQVQLSAYPSRKAPRLSGVVRTVSADRLLDEKSRTPYFLARVEVDRASLARAGKHVELMPGMPADVLIVTGERTMVDYLFEPFIDAIWRSFREV